MRIVKHLDSGDAVAVEEAGRGDVFSTFDYDRIDDLIEIGYRKTVEKLGNLNSLGYLSNFTKK